DLSDRDHYKEGQHNADYDHEAFLGEDAKTFDQLSPEESRRRLALIVDKIDSDSDGFVTQEELKDWIRYTQKKYVRDNVDRTWKSHNPENADKISWDSYSKQSYGHINVLDANELNREGGMSYKSLYDRDRRRWIAADLDGDDSLTKEDFSAFLHPEETPHMRDLVVLETLEDIDKDKDGKISLKEFIGDMYVSTEEGEEEPEWVQNEKQHFAAYRDKDGDGYMNEEEVKDWVLPPDFDHAEAEARHLIYESDRDADQKLSRDEILAKYDLFVGSQATDFGEGLLRHDEF
ncbi:hypothetical protein AAG570_007651, partial [Ranatra chinensis]